MTPAPPPAFAAALRMADYTYALPPERIAQHPLAQRDAARLLHWHPGTLADYGFAALPKLLPANTLLVTNTTRVVPARIVAHRATGARVEVFCLAPLHPTAEVAMAMAQTTAAQWHCLVGNAKKWKADEELTVEGPDGFWLKMTKEEPLAEGYRVAFRWMPSHLPFADVLHRVGQIPLPPYLNRPPGPEDTHRYQALFAQHPGAVAAPTASLHFTPTVMESLRAHGIDSVGLTLHVGAGTFRPVDAETPAAHPMHTEQVAIPAATVARLAAHSGPVVPVGTTAFRTLESLYWHGLAVQAGHAHPAQMAVNQWEPYTDTGLRAPLPPARDVLAHLAQRLEQTQTPGIVGHTGLMVLPGYRPQVANALVTNFHQPGSTLLLLVAALCGAEWKSIYAHALANGYRFLSYGDASLLHWAAEL